MIGRDGGAEWARWIVEEREGGEMCWVGIWASSVALDKIFYLLISNLRHATDQE